MTLRRLGLAVPLAILVAVLVHFATFGLQHAPAGEHANGLIVSLAAALGLAALCTVLLVALRKRRNERRHSSRTHSRYIFPVDLTFGGALAYAAIERSEGHVPFGYGWSFVTLLAVVALVCGAALLVERVLRCCGEALAALADRIAPSYRVRAFFVPLAERPLIAFTRSAHTRRGRAPPLFS